MRHPRATADVYWSWLCRSESCRHQETEAQRKERYNLNPKRGCFLHKENISRIRFEQINLKNYGIAKLRSSKQWVIVQHRQQAKAPTAIKITWKRQKRARSIRALQILFAAEQTRHTSNQAKTSFIKVSHIGINLLTNLCVNKFSCIRRFAERNEIPLFKIITNVS